MSKIPTDCALRVGVINAGGNLITHLKTFLELVQDPAERQHVSDALGIIVHDINNHRQKLILTPEMLPEPEEKPPGLTNLADDLAGEYAGAAPEGASIRPPLTEA